ncbi:MAG: polyprenol monophosphomannose synthase [Candidatus Ryanbacteria bacterium]|nr:polyprenol monophosphomannose synthase [Candidatus Ryanbacteria bacterium]
MSQSDTIVVIPTYKEAKNIATLLLALTETLPTVSILVVDDNSPDETQAIVRTFAVHHPNVVLKQRVSKEGLGLAYRDAFQGLQNSSFSYIFMMDADLSHDYREIPRMLELAKSVHCVVGSRYIAGGNVENWYWLRMLLSRYANWYVRAILQKPVHDFTAGFMCFRREIISTLDMENMSARGYAFLVEFKYRILSLGYSLAETPITFVERRAGASKISWPIIWEAAWTPWRLRMTNKRV